LTGEGGWRVASWSAPALESFRKLGSNCRIIYTTHSHHLINPEWLESTLVVRNEGIHLTQEDAESYNAKKTNITVMTG
jgi:predicted ATP-dependent endonuclease of OLD family